MTRIATILLVLLAATACKTKGDPTPARDYRSLNDTSLAFLKNTLDEGRASSRRDLKNFFATFQERKTENKLISRESIAFFGESLSSLERSNSREAWKRFKDEARGAELDYWANARFGFLDSGD